MLSTLLLLLIGFILGKWSIIEPIVVAEVVAPYELNSTIIAGLSRRFGILLSTEESGGFCYIKAEVKTKLNLFYKITRF